MITVPLYLQITMSLLKVDGMPFNRNMVRFEIDYNDYEILCIYCNSKYDDDW